MTRESHLTKESHPSTGTRNDRLGSYLAAAVGAGTLAATSDAAIVNLDLSAHSGPNAGLAAGSSSTISLSGLDARLTGSLGTLNAALASGGALFTGLRAGNGADIVSTYNYAGPRKLSEGTLIDAAIQYFTNTLAYTAFRIYTPTFEVDGYEYGGYLYQSPDFGAGSFLGFRSANGHYGWLEVTWDSSTQVFQILGGAFEDVAGVGIEAGAVAAVPEPAGALGTLGLLSAGMFLRRRKLAA